MKLCCQKKRPNDALPYTIETYCNVLQHFLSHPAQSVSPMLLCNIYFCLEQEVINLREFYEQCCTGSDIVRETLHADLRVTAGQLFQLIVFYRTTIQQLGSPYCQSLPSFDGALIYGEVLVELFKDQLYFEGSNILSIGEGPLSKLTRECDNFRKGTLPSKWPIFQFFSP